VISAHASLTETIDTPTAGGRLVFHILSGLAEFEGSIIGERTMAGLASARVPGWLGRRPRSLTEADLAAARALLSDPNIMVNAAAKGFGAAPSTIYWHLTCGRRGLVEEANA
jgi:DNA invertase Pin-like site-specific DNA recombinase